MGIHCRMIPLPVAPIPCTDSHCSTFPSLYVSVIGGISVSDSCGYKGSVHTNPAPVAVQAITTASYPNWPSTCRAQGQDAEAVIDTLALSDIACPTWGLSDPFTTSCDGSSYMTETYGAPYNPVILVPTELMSIDPAWAACTTDTANALLTLPCGIYDPPIALSTASAMVPGGASGDPLAPEGLPIAAATALHRAGRLAPSVTPVNDPPMPTTPMAAPANAGSSSLPKPTTVPSSGSSDPSGKSSLDGSDPNGPSDPAAEVLKLDPMAPSAKQSKGSSQTNPVQEGGQAPAADHQTSGSNNPGSTSQQKEASNPASGSQVSDPNGEQAVPQAPTTINLGGGSQSTQGVGALINGGIGGGSVPAPAPAQVAAFTPHVVTALGQTLSITDPSAVAIAGSTLSVGGPAHTSDGKYYSLAPSGNLIAGTLASSPGPSSPPVLSVAGSTYTANSASAFVIAGQTLTPGGQINVGSTPISLPPSANVAVVGGSTQLLTTPAPSPNPAVLKFMGSTFTANAASQFIVAGQTLTPGGRITVSNTPISLQPSANVAVVGGSTQLLATPAPSPNPAVMRFAGSTYSANAASQFVVAGQTLTAGGQITIDGTPISLNPSAGVAVVGGSTQVLTTPGPSPNAAVMTFAGSIYTANAASQIVVAGKTLTPGGQIIVSGTTLSLAPSANLAVIGSSTQLLTTPVPTANPAILSFAGSTYTANSASQFIIAGQTLTPGGTITASGTPISLPQGTNIAVIGTSTQTLATAPALLTAEAPVLTWQGSTYTADASSDFVIASQTLTPGGIITVLGTPIRLASGAADAVVGSSTQTLASAVITPADIVTIDGQLVTANPTGFAVKGTTVLPGSKGVLVDGTMVSLAPGGTLFVGNSSVVLPTNGPGTGAGPAAFEGGEGKLGISGIEWVGPYMAFWTVLGGFYLVW